MIKELNGIFTWARSSDRIRAPPLHMHFYNAKSQEEAAGSNPVGSTHIH
jgi:hypothetical protein